LALSAVFIFSKESNHVNRVTTKTTIPAAAQAQFSTFFVIQIYSYIVRVSPMWLILLAQARLHPLGPSLSPTHHLVLLRETQIKTTE
jgi:hypothetical protein